MLDPGLYLVATPIGNLEDITLRALRVLKEVDRIACEDTRQTQKLLNHFDISTPTVSYHEHNEQARTVELIALLQQGGRIAVVSDAGTPAFSDPGFELVRAALAAGVRVIPIPGANAALNALVASGFDTERFLYVGFLAAKPGARRTELETLASTNAGLTLVAYEAPHRILDTLTDVEAVWGEQVRVVVARELTKIHEEYLRGTAREVRQTLSSRERVRGEIVLLIEAAAPQPALAGGSVVQQVKGLMEVEGLDEKDALKRVARERGVSKSDVYRELQRERSRK
ncbi:MAG TPA: 16S rRNA (cytidine(1402)-2'-O)-methyltransferase [Acidobacteriaceae bacterium]|nr:16S rRNA (cytidine(1402)-2'-O)-methyltransferase [Acidobacteriaceae bacterium]